MKQILAIDPGKNGGIAAALDGHAQCWPMPATDGDVLDLIVTLLCGNIREAYVEEVGGYCGGTGAPGSAMFNFGKGYGFILGVLASRGIRVVLVKPQKWQKHFGLGTVKSSGGKTPWKNKLKQKAQQLFPNADVTLKTSDALLLWEYGQSHE